MRKITVLLILLSVFYINTFAQSGYFNNIFHINGLWSYGRSIVYKDSNYYVSALSYDTIYSIYAVRRLSLCKSDYNGNLIFQKSIGWGTRNYYLGYSGCFQQTSDNGFFSVGVVEDTNESNAYLVKVNSNFDTVFFKEYRDTIFNYLEFQQGKETFDKGFIMVGTLPGSGTYDQDILVLKADSTGNEQWRKTINLGGIEYARNVIQTPDKGYLLGCYTYTPTNYLSGDGRIIKLDSLGNFEWGKSIGGLKQDGVPIVALAKDSNYIVASSYAYVTYTSADLSELRVQILKINKTDRSIIWDKQYDTIRRNNYVSMIKTDKEDNLIIIGSKDLLNGMNYNGMSWLLKINQNGDSLMYRQFYRSNSYSCYNIVYDFSITEDNSMVTCGQFDTISAFTYLWLAKMDSLGCMQPGCQYVGVEELQKAKAGELKVFPNPAKDYFIIEFDNAEISKDAVLEITDMLGRKMQSIKINTNKIQINTKDFAKGLYHCYLINNGKIISKCKISIQ